MSSHRDGCTLGRGPGHFGLTAAAIVAACILLVSEVFGPTPCLGESMASPPLLSPAGMAAGLDEHGLALFVADSATGQIYYSRPTTGAGTPGRPVTLTPLAQLQHPSLLAYHQGTLYVYEAADRQLLGIRIWEAPPAPAWRVLLSGRRLGGIAVSASGLVAVSDVEQRELVFVREDAEVSPQVFRSSDIRSPRELSFAGDRLHLSDDGVHKTLRVAERYLHELEIGPAETDLADPAPAITSLVSAEGVSYAATDRQLLIYLAKEKFTLSVPWTSFRSAAGAKLLAAAGDWLFLLDDQNEIRQLRRPVPADIRLEAPYWQANQALALLYGYLLDENLLPVRTVTLARTYPDPRQLLIEERVLVGPGQEESGAQPGGNAPAGVPTAKDGAAIAFFWRLNGQQGRMLTAGQTVLLPNLPIRSRILYRPMELSGRSLAAVLRETVFSPDLKSRVLTPFYLSRRNPQLKGITDLSLVTSGRLDVPVEFWELTAALPAADLNRKEPGLVELRNLAPGHVLVLSKQPLLGDPASIAEPPPVAMPTAVGLAAVGPNAIGPTAVGPPTATPCDSLREQSTSLAKRIDYPPGSQARLDTVTIGIMEKQDTVDKNHLAFSAAAGDSAWVRLSEDSLVEEDPVSRPPGQATEVTLNPAASADYIQHHHGTHVAGIVGGRGDCFSGMLPKSQLYLIDSTDTSSSVRGIKDAIRARIQTINVSADFDRPTGETDDLTDVVKNKLGTMFVVAAGNKNQDYNQTMAAATPPVSWADYPNVLVVTGLGPDNILVPPGGGPVGRGRRAVHLAAPGALIYSATAGNEFAPGTGTSQATPQVTSAAAILMNRDCRNPGRVKARLIATANWRPELKDFVWGGLLDFEGAVGFPGETVLRTRSHPGQVFRIDELRGPNLVLTRAPWLFSRDPKAYVDAPDKIPLQNILSIHQIGEPNELPQRYRIVFVDDRTSEVHIILDAEISGKLRTKGQSLWNEQAAKFEATTLLDRDLELSQIVELYRSCRTYPDIPGFS